MTTLRTLRSGTIVEVDDKGKASFPTCSWLVRVPSLNPEPDSEADCYRDVECNAHLKAIAGVSLEDGNTCENDHEHLSYEYYSRSGQEAHDSWIEQHEEAEIGPWNSLAHVR